MDDRRLMKVWAAMLGVRWGQQTLAGIAVAGVAQILSWLDAPFADVTLAAALMLAGALAAVPRKAIHFRLGYHRRLPGPMFFETALIGTWISLGVAFLHAPPTPQIVLTTAVGLWVLVLLAAALTLSRAESAGLPRVSAVVKRCRSVIALRDLLSRLSRVPLFGYLDARWDDRPEKGKASGFVVGVASTLVLAAAAAAPALVRPEPQPSKPPPATQVNRTRTTGLGADARTRTPAPRSVPTGRLRPSGYASTCPGAVTPGFPAPPPEDAKLRALWLGTRGIQGRGALVAGCAQAAQPMTPSSDTWWTTGRCGELVMSLGLSAPDVPPVMLLGQVARFALRFAERGTLIGASERAAIGHGDFQVVRAAEGDFVLIRAALTDASSTAHAVGQDQCARVASAAARYTVVPPGLIDPWMEIVADGWVWPEAADGRIVFRGERGHPVATATCASSQRCSVAYAGLVIEGRAHGRVDSARLVQFGPPTGG